jgi:hypothetical protein
MQKRYEALQLNPASRPIARLVGMETMPPGPKRDDPLTEFVPVRGELGYQVPMLLLDYLASFGGIEFSGLPISDTISIGEGIFRQCFENLCLDLNTQIEGQSGLSLAPLGEMYKEMYYPDPVGGQISETGGLIELTITEFTQSVPSDESFEIRVTVTEAGIPLTNREPYITVTSPDGKQRRFQMEPSDARGETQISLPPVGAPNVSLIPYKVCLDLTNTDPVCVEDHYLIWNYPR